MTEEYFGARFPVAIDMLAIDWEIFDQGAFVGFTEALFKCWEINDMRSAFEDVHLRGRWNVDAEPYFLGCEAFKVIILHSDVSWWSLKIFWAIFISSSISTRLETWAVGRGDA